MYLEKHHIGDLKDKSFLVTGGAGFIGSNIVEYLLKFGAGKVRVFDNFSTGSIKNIQPYLKDSRFELLEGDIRDLSSCHRAVNGMNYVSHQAALGSVPRSINDPITTNSVNVTGFLNMLMAAKEGAVKSFVYAASSSTYGDHPALPKVEEQIGNPLSPYAVTKYVNELYAQVFSRVYGFNTIGLRYFNVFGPRQNPSGPYAAVIPLFIESALNSKRPIINGDGDTSRDFTFVENAVQANVKSMLKPDLITSEIINIAFGERTTLNELWNKISEILEIALLPEYAEERRGDVKHSLADISKAKKIINYVPTISISGGMIETVNWYKDNR